MLNTQAIATVDQRIARQSRDAPVLDKVRYRAVWRSRYLIILPIDCHRFRQSVSAVMEGDRERILACLEHSSVQLLLLSPELPVVELIFWAELCRKAGKPAFLRRYALGAAYSCLEQLRSSKTLLESVLAATALLFLSPVFLSLVLWLAATTSGAIFERRWSVGARGKLYREILFDTTAVGVGWRFKTYGLNRLPQLINIFWGEMRFQQTKSWFLEQTPDEFKIIDAQFR